MSEHFQFDPNQSRFTVRAFATGMLSALGHDPTFAVRDFRGAMAGRGDKGLLITTGTFTADAKKEATRDGAPPIDLIDGDRLCDLLKTYDLGVHTTTRTVEDVTIDITFFTDM